MNIIPYLGPIFGASFGLLITISSNLNEPFYSCLLYTSDAADERSSVDLGGRRIIKKKNDIKLIING